MLCIPTIRSITPVKGQSIGILGRYLLKQYISGMTISVSHCRSFATRAPPEALSAAAIQAELKALPQWKLQLTSTESMTAPFIVRKFQFQNFREAFTFMTQMAFLAEEVSRCNQKGT
jgi:hypothetical protein